MFWKTKTINDIDTENAEQDGFFGNTYMEFDTKKSAHGKEETSLRYGERAKAGHTAGPSGLMLKNIEYN